jgi:hypothetical protein
MYINYWYTGRQVVKRNICVFFCGVMFGLQLVEYGVRFILCADVERSRNMDCGVMLQGMVYDRVDYASVRIWTVKVTQKRERSDYE